MSTIEDLRSILNPKNWTTRDIEGGLWRKLEKFVRLDLGITAVGEDKGNASRREIVKKYIDEGEIHVGSERSGNSYAILLGDAYASHLKNTLEGMDNEEEALAAAALTAAAPAKAAEAGAGGEEAKAGGGRKRRKSKRRKSKKKKTRTRRRRRR